MTSLLERESGVDSCTEILTSRLRTSAANKEMVDLGEWIQFFAFDVVGEFNFSAKFGFLEKGDFGNLMPQIKFRLRYAAVIGQIPILHKLLLGNPLVTLLMPDMEKWDAILMFTLKAMGARTSLRKDGEIERKQAEARGVDILGRWLDTHEDDPGKLSTEDMIVHLTTNVFAGSDTTAVSLRSIFYQLMRNPEKYTKIRAEIDQADKEGKLSEYISYRESTTHLPYTSAVIKEGMRMHPAVGLPLERDVPPGGATICGRYFPAGTVVGVNAWVVQYNPRVFPNPDNFIPERWIGSTEDGLKEMEQSLFYFGGGSRTCIGKNISLLEIHKLVPQLVREFEFRFHDPNKDWTMMCGGLVLQDGFHVDVVDRRER
jgi:cytochrome P450